MKTCLILIFGSLALATLLASSPVAAECCPKKEVAGCVLDDPTKKIQTCDDCSSPNPFCGVGACDSKGCNCQGGCRKINKDGPVDEKVYTLFSKH